MKKLLMLSALLLYSAIGYTQDKLPIIDMHLHSVDRLLSDNRMCFPKPCDKVPTKIKTIDELYEQTVAQLDQNNIVLGVLSGHNYQLNKKWVSKDSRFVFGVIVNNPKYIDYELINKEIDNGTIKVMGEVTSQYNGYAMNAPELDSIFAIAEHNDLPVLVHSGGLGGTPHFPIQKGNPMHLNEVIQKYPKLRVYIENAAWPFGDEVISLMYTNPNVYADLSTISWIIPQTAFHQYLKKLVNAGLIDRLMFGSDQMIWPESIPIAIDAINSADFLNKDQKRAIFYDNAARFLKLSDETIKKHHSKFK